MEIKVEAFCVVTQRDIVVGYQRFRDPCCLHLQGEDAENGGSMDL